MTKIGAITVGQSPRVDVIPEMEPILGDSFEILQMGGLDGLSKEEIAAFKPRENDHILVSRLTDGSSVTFGESYILPRLQDCIHKLEENGASLILFLCTGEFPENFDSKVPLIFPNRILSAVVPALIPGGRLTVLTPSAAPTEQTGRKWEQLVPSVTALPASPYDGTAAVLKKAAETRPEETDLIVLDCIGYTMEMKEQIHQLTGKPVILPRTLTARVIQGLGDA